MLNSIVPLWLGAILLFLVQPLMAKEILPVHGGSASVWTACLVFYQCGLLGGYLYAFLLSHLGMRWQAVTHGALLVSSLFFLPSDSLIVSEASTFAPEVSIFLDLSRSIGLPYLLLASTSPLLQSWRSREIHDPRIFRWFAISNLGSILGLLSYPFVIEPYLRVQQQQLGWTIGFVLYIVLVGIALGFHLTRDPDVVGHQNSEKNNTSSSSAAWSWFSAFCCVLLAACSSTVLAASTNQMSQSGVVVPFLWVLPLSLYLASFVICFQWPWFASPSVWIPLYWLSCVWGCVLLFWGLLFPIPWQIAGYATLVFACSMACHAQLHALRPPARFLTHYYLLIALGGALGGAFTGLISPRLFSDNWEFHCGMGVTAILLALCRLIELFPRLQRERFARNILFPATCLPAFFILLLLYAHVEATLNERIVERRRDFFGIVSVLDKPEVNQRIMLHGKTQHGMQPLDGNATAEATLYFTPDSGVAKAIAWRRERLSRHLRIGVIGLGTGSLLTHAKPGDQVCFYEISPAVEALARKHFSYLSSHQGEVSVALGDGRQLLASELQKKGSHHFDILVVDAFSGDALPMHLLTLEAIRLYQSHLAEGGLIAFQITNRYLDLSPIIAAAAREAKGVAAIVESARPPDSISSQVRWAIIFPLESSKREVPNWASSSTPDAKGVVPWTDDFGSLRSALR